MKIKFLITIFFVLVNGFLYTQNIDLKRYSSIMDGDYENDYRGYAVAIYIEKDVNDEELDFIKDTLSSVGRDISKLSNNNLWLCWKALGEWDIEDGEVYLIFCADSPYPDNGILIIAIIEDNGESFRWWGKFVSEKDFKNFIP
jgi:hypothetical protein